MRRVFCLVIPAALGAAFPVLAQQPGGRGNVHVAVGHFDGAGVYGEDPALTTSNLSAEVGAEAHVLRCPVLTCTLGAAFRLAAAEAGVGEDDPDPFTSGFRPQHLDLYARLAGNSVAVTAGLVIDLGPDIFETDPDPDATFQFLNSDMQHAVRLGVSGEAPVGRARLHGSLDGFLTLPHSYTSTYEDIPPGPDEPGELITIEGEIDFGDQFILRGGGAFAVGAAEIGLDLAYAVTTAGENITRFPDGIDLTGGVDGEFRSVFESRYVLSLIPYVTVAPSGIPFALTLAVEAPGGAYSEHVAYGITLTGDNQTKVRFPLSLRVRYGF